jgi:transcriptional regulator with XRE-family HTH domain
MRVRVGQPCKEIAPTEREEVSVDGCTDRASQPRRIRRNVVGMDNRAEVREFLTSRRAKITPEEARLPQMGQRRVPGLRRSEVAALAGMSVEYYAKLERGSLGGVSASVLDAIARALQLDEAERAHLFHLAHAADGTSAAMRPRRRSPKGWTARSSLQWTLDSITAGPAIVGNNRSDLLATNHLGRALYADVYNHHDAPPNFARFTFLDSAAHRFYPDWTLPPTSRSPTSAPPPGRTRTTRTSTTWSANCPPAATSSDAAGPPTTSAPTAPAPNTSTTTSSATWPSPTKAWTCEPNPA